MTSKQSEPAICITNEGYEDLEVMNSPGLKHLWRTGFAGRTPARDYPLANRCDAVDTLLIFDDVRGPYSAYGCFLAYA